MRSRVHHCCHARHHLQLGLVSAHGHTCVTTVRGHATGCKIFWLSLSLLTQSKEILWYAGNCSLHGLDVQLGKHMNALKQGCSGQLSRAGHQRLACPTASAHGTSLKSAPSQGCFMHATMCFTRSVHCTPLNLVAVALMSSTHLQPSPTPIPQCRGDFGRLGHGDSADVFIPQPISFFSGHQVQHVACGDTHTLVVIEGGQLYSFGRNQNGQLGLGHTQDSLAPQLVQAIQVRGRVQ